MNSHIVNGEEVASPKTGKMHRFVVTFGGDDGDEYTIDVDEALTPNDSFRETFYPMFSLKEMAAHIVWNHCYQQFSYIEGLYEEQQANTGYWKIVSSQKGDPDVDVWEIPID